MSLYPTVNEPSQRAFSAEAMFGGEETITRGAVYEKLAGGKVSSNFYGREVKEMKLKEENGFVSGALQVGLSVVPVAFSVFAMIAGFVLLDPCSPYWTATMESLTMALIFGGLVGTFGGGGVAWMGMCNLGIAARYRDEREKYLNAKL